MTKKILILFTGQFRTFFEIECHIQENVRSIKTISKASVYVGFVTRESSEFYFPTRKFRTFSSQLDRNAVLTFLTKLQNDKVIDGYFFDVVPELDRSNIEVRDIEMFLDVAWLNFKALQKTYEFSDRKRIEFDSVIKLRPDMLLNFCDPIHSYNAEDFFPANMELKIPGGNALFDDIMGNGILSIYVDEFEIFGKVAFKIYGLAFWSAISKSFPNLSPSAHVWLKKYLVANGICVCPIKSYCSTILCRPKILFEFFKKPLVEDDLSSLVSSYTSLNHSWMNTILSQNPDEVSNVKEFLISRGIEVKPC